jgi:hypothetical protein
VPEEKRLKTGRGETGEHMFSKKFEKEFGREKAISLELVKKTKDIVYVYASQTGR